MNKKQPTDEELLERIVVDPGIFGGKPIIRGYRMAVEHLLGMLAAGATAAELLDGYDWLEPEDIQACLLFAQRSVGNERVQPRILDVTS